jgi:hypothetical protein
MRVKMPKITWPKGPVGWVALVLIALGAVQYINWFVYPFTSASPNYADVERVYSRMVVPASWQKTGEGANKGLHGRQCPIESDGCFSKVGSFDVPKTDYDQALRDVTQSMGCTSISIRRVPQSSAVKSANFECRTNGIKISGTVIEYVVESNWEVSINASTR